MDVIKEGELRLKCIENISNSITDVMKNYLAPDNGVQTLSTMDWEKMEDAQAKIAMAFDFNDKTPIDENWFGLFKEVKVVQRKIEVIDTGIELNEDFLPNSNLQYTIEFDGVDKFKATLEQSNFERKLVGVEDAPRVLRYKLDKPLDEFTKDEIEQVLNYRGLSLENDGFEASDVFMEKSFVTLVGVDVEITVMVRDTIMIEDGETLEEFKNRTVDIYLHGSGENGHLDKVDLGGNSTIDFI